VAEMTKKKRCRLSAIKVQKAVIAVEKQENGVDTFNRPKNGCFLTIYYPLSAK
jgi:hypothetical protein